MKNKVGCRNLWLGNRWGNKLWKKWIKCKKSRSIDQFFLQTSSRSLYILFVSSSFHHSFYIPLFFYSTFLDFALNSLCQDYARSIPYIYISSPLFKKQKINKNFPYKFFGELRPLYVREKYSRVIAFLSKWIFLKNISKSLILDAIKIVKCNMGISLSLSLCKQV